MLAIKLLVIVTVPVAVFFSGSYLMMYMTGKVKFPRNSYPASVPLNLRFRGYDKTSAIDHWKWLGPDGRLAERRFLECDLVFPVVYGGAMLASLLLAWAAIGRPLNPTWFVAPVAITVLLDWTENLTQWHQLNRFLQGDVPQTSLMQVASLATSLKFACSLLTVLIIVGLSAWMLLNSVTASKMTIE